MFDIVTGNPAINKGAYEGNKVTIDSGVVIIDYSQGYADADGKFCYSGTDHVIHGDLIAFFTSIGPSLTLPTEQRYAAMEVIIQNILNPPVIAG